jgi:hypothetical protein
MLIWNSELASSRRSNMTWGIGGINLTPVGPDQHVDLYVASYSIFTIVLQLH